MTAREVILDVTIAGALIFSLLSRRIISRLITRYGSGVVRLVTLGRYAPDHSRKMDRMLTGIVGVVIALLTLVYFLYRLAPGGPPDIGR